MNKLWIILVFLFPTTVFAQKHTNWSVKSDDGKVKVTNYVCDDGGVDSVVLKAKSYRLSFKPFEFDDFLNKMIRPNASRYFVAIEVLKVKDDMYVVLGKGGNVINLFSMSVIFIDKGQIVKYLIIKSFDRQFTSFRFIYNEESKELVFRREMVDESDPAEVYDVDFAKKQVQILQPESENLDEYLEKLPSKLTANTYWYSNFMNFYKLKF